MKVLINIGHPGQVHLFKNLVWELEKRGDDCMVTVVDKDVALHLLDAYKIPYRVVGRARRSVVSKALEMVRIDLELLKVAGEYRPDVLLGGVGNAYVGHVGRIIHRPSIVFDDTEHAKLDHLLMDPFVSSICTPSSFSEDLGKKQVRYDSIQQMAYLHPQRFKPDPSILSELGIEAGTRFIVVRFVSWTADHDLDEWGVRDKVGLVNFLSTFGRVLITSEGKLPEELERFRARVPAERIHDLLYYATLYVGEGGTMTSEAAVLGTHAIMVSSLGKRLGVFQYLAGYGLVWTVDTDDEAKRIASDLLSKPDVAEIGKRKAQRLVKENGDLTSFMVGQLDRAANVSKERSPAKQVRIPGGKAHNAIEPKHP